VHQQTLPAKKMLADEGFRFTGMIDIFEGGPVVSCRRDEIRTVKQSRRATIVDVADHLPATASDEQIIANTRRDFRVCKGLLEVQGKDGARITNHTALSLQVRVGDVVRYASVRASASAAHTTVADESEELSEAVPGF
jgi:arginine N-succinyltransferase